MTEHCVDECYLEKLMISKMRHKDGLLFFLRNLREYSISCSDSCDSCLPVERNLDRIVIAIRVIFNPDNQVVLIFKFNLVELLDVLIQFLPLCTYHQKLIASLY